MRLIRDLSMLDAAARGGAVAIGNFDGVHRGHARIVQRLMKMARQLGGPAVVFTFDPHPVRLLRPESAPPPLTWTERKAALLSKLGVDVMVVYPTDEALLKLSPGEFFQRIVLESLEARAVVEGPNFFFGRDRGGDVQLLEQLCRDAGLQLEIVEPVRMGEQYISSSRVRQSVREGRLEEAASLLTEPYRIRGLVTHGAARGARIGFPTANVSAVDTLLPALGVYAGRGYWNKQAWPAAIHIGPNPTFHDEGVKVEAHLVGFRGSLYGEPLELDFAARLRDIRSFASPEELAAQLQLDVAAAAKWAGPTNLRL